MTAEQVTASRAREFFAHPSQQCFGLNPDDLPDEGAEYWACGPICGMFHQMPWTGVWMVHYGADPAHWGRLVEPSREALRAFWRHHQPQRIVGWTEERNRLAVAFARRVGFVVDGYLDLPTGRVVMQGWVG